MENDSLTKLIETKLNQPVVLKPATDSANLLFVAYDNDNHIVARVYRSFDSEFKPTRQIRYTQQ